MRFYAFKCPRNIMTKRFIKIATAALLLGFLSAAVVRAAGTDVIEVEADGSYRLETGAASDLAKAVALFTAKRKAVKIAAKYLVRKGVVNIYAEKADEIYSLAAGETQAEILAEQKKAASNAAVYHVRIRARISAADIIRAERQDGILEKEESKQPYLKEMEPDLPAKIEPGKDIAIAYLLIREKQWRKGMIYLDRLTMKYPNWGDLYMAKALIYYVLREPVPMKKALDSACRMGNQTGCDDLKSLKKVHKYDFSISIVD